MSTTIKSIYGKTWTISTGIEDGQVAIGPDAGSDRVFDVTDLLDALKAVGLLEGEYVKAVPVEMASDGVLRPVKGEPHAMDTVEYHEWSAGLSVSRAAYWRKENARAAEAEAAERQLTERRNALAQEITPHAGTPPLYADFDRDIRAFINKVIDLQDQLANASK